MAMVQSIIIHDVIGRLKIILGQLRDGLGTLGFGAQMSEFPELFESLFVATNTNLGSDAIINALDFPASVTAEEEATKNYLIQFLRKAESIKTLKEFLVFTTGAPCLPDFGLGRIGVKFEPVPTIFASTCLRNVTLPPSFPDEGTFSLALEAVMSTSSKSCNCI